MPRKRKSSEERHLTPCDQQFNPAKPTLQSWDAEVPVFVQSLPSPFDLLACELDQLHASGQPSYGQNSNQVRVTFMHKFVF